MPDDGSSYEPKHSQVKPINTHIYIYIYIYIYTYTHTHTHIYIYIYIYRERERERERDCCCDWQLVSLRVYIFFTTGCPMSHLKTAFVVPLET